MNCKRCGNEAKWFMTVYSFKEYHQYGTMETHDELWCISCVAKGETDDH